MTTTTTTTDTVAALKSRQMIWPDWMQAACAGFTTVQVTTLHTPFGSFVQTIDGVA